MARQCGLSSRSPRYSRSCFSSIRRVSPTKVMMSRNSKSNLPIQVCSQCGTMPGCRWRSSIVSAYRPIRRLWRILRAWWNAIRASWHAGWWRAGGVWAALPCKSASVRELIEPRFALACNCSNCASEIISAALCILSLRNRVRPVNAACVLFFEQTFILALPGGEGRDGPEPSLRRPFGIARNDQGDRNL